MPPQQFLNHGFETVDGLLRGKAQIEARLQLSRDDIGCARAGGNIRYLETGGLKMLVAAIPGSRREFGQRGRHGMHRVVGELRVGNMPLNSVHRETPAQAAAPADFDGVAEGALARRLSDQAPVDGLVALAQRLHHAARAVDRRALLVAGDQECDRAAMRRVPCHEFLAGRQHGREAALHVGSPAPIQEAVLDDRKEGIAPPLVQRTRRHHIGMACEAEYRPSAPAFRPEIVDRTEAHAFHFESDGLEPADHHLLAAAVRGADRCACNQLFGQSQGVGFQRRGRHQKRNTGAWRRRLIQVP